MSFAVVFTTGGQPLADGNRVTDGLLVKYDFTEQGGNFVVDQAPAILENQNTPLTLSIQDPGNVTWNVDSLTIDAETRLLSAVATGLVAACKASEEISVEAWITPADTTQEGPARVVACSPLGTGFENANFMLGAGSWSGNYVDGLNDNYRGRVRNEQTNESGWLTLDGDGGFHTPSGVIEASLQHVVLTVSDNGSGGKVSEFWVNGQRLNSRQQDGSFSDSGTRTWDESYVLSLANENDSGNPTADRHWLGTYHAVAIFDRALSEEDIQQNYFAGPDGVSGFPEPDLGFELATTTIQEPVGAGVPTPISVTSSATYSENILISYSVGGTAQSGTHYEALSGSVVLPAGMTSAEFDITPITQSGLTGDETVILTMTSASAGTITGQTAHTVTIVDIDTPGDADFALSSSSTVQTAGQAAITVTLSRANRNPVVVNLFPEASSTAEEDTDYQWPNSPPTPILTIPAGQLSSQFLVTILDTMEAGEHTLDLLIQNVTPGSVGTTQTTHTLTIQGSAISAWPSIGSTGSRIPDGDLVASGSMHLTTADSGTESTPNVISGYNITGNISIDEDVEWVTIQDCKIHAANISQALKGVVQVNSGGAPDSGHIVGPGILVEYCELYLFRHAIYLSSKSSVDAERATVSNCWIHHCEDGFSSWGNTNVLDNLWTSPGGTGGPHSDFFQLRSGSNVRAEGNFVYGPVPEMPNGYDGDPPLPSGFGRTSNSAFQLGAKEGPATHLEINNNLLIGGAQCMIQLDSNGSWPAPTDCTVMNNRFGNGYKRGQIWDVDSDVYNDLSNTFSGNVWHEGYMIPPGYPGQAQSEGAAIDPPYVGGSGSGALFPKHWLNEAPWWGVPSNGTMTNPAAGTSV